MQKDYKKIAQVVLACVLMVVVLSGVFVFFGKVNKRSNPSQPFSGKVIQNSDMKTYLQETYRTNFATENLGVMDFLYCPEKKSKIKMDTESLPSDCVGRKNKTVMLLSHMSSADSMDSVEKKIVVYLEKNFIIPSGREYTIFCNDEPAVSSKDYKLRNCNIVGKLPNSINLIPTTSVSLYYFNLAEPTINFLMFSPMGDVTKFKSLFQGRASNTSFSFFEKAYAGGDPGEGGGSALGNFLGSLAAAVGATSASGYTASGNLSAALASGMSLTGPNTACCNEFGDAVSGSDSNVGDPGYSVYVGSGSAGLVCTSGEVPISSAKEYSCYTPAHECCGPEGVWYPEVYTTWQNTPPGLCSSPWGSFIAERTLQTCVSNAVAGVCSPSHYNCAIGSSSNNIDGSSAWTWSCDGLNSGASATCSENKPPSGSISSDPAACAISTGQSTCQVKLIWSTTNPVGTSGVTRDGTAGLLYASNNSPAGGQNTNVPYEADGNIIYRLYNNANELGAVNVSVSCAQGSFDTIGGVCANPQVVSAEVKNLYYPPGSIELVCSNSNAYSVSRGGIVFIPETPYTGPVTIPNLMIEDNYSIKCIHGSVSDQVARFYDATPDPAVVSLQVSPITIGKDGKVVASWKTKFPTNACTLSAKVVCANNACTAAQNTFQASLNTALQTEKTDLNDPATSRLITTAVKTVAPGHLNSDWLALGRKTLQISYTTDLIYDCGGGNKETKRIQVTKSEIQ